jgi:hypothetical protein
LAAEDKRVAEEAARAKQLADEKLAAEEESAYANQELANDDALRVDEAATNASKKKRASIARKLGARKAKEIAKSNRNKIPAKEKLSVNEERAKQLAAEEEVRVEQSPNKAVMKLMEIARKRAFGQFQKKSPSATKLKKKVSPAKKSPSRKSKTKIDDSFGVANIGYDPLKVPEENVHPNLERDVDEILLEGNDASLVKMMSVVEMIPRKMLEQIYKRTFSDGRNFQYTIG